MTAYDTQPAAKATAGPAATTTAILPKSVGPTPPNLQGAPYQWIGGTFKLWVSRDWFAAASDFTANNGLWFAPSRYRELLGVLRDHGMLTWPTPREIERASAELHVRPMGSTTMQIGLGISAFKVLGLPPGSSALVGKRADHGLVATISIPHADAIAGTDFPLSAGHKQTLFKALETFTHLPVLPGPRQALVDQRVNCTMGAGAVAIEIDGPQCEVLFGKTAYLRWFASGSDSGARFDLASGAESIADLTDDEVTYINKWLEHHVRNGRGSPRPIAMSRALLESLRRIEGLPKEIRDRIFVQLNREPDDRTPGQLTAAFLERTISQAEFDEECARAGFVAKDDVKRERPPTFDYPIPARIDQQNGLVTSGEAVELTIAIDWPNAYTRDQDWEYQWRPRQGTVDWLFERATRTGKLQERERSYFGSKDKGHSNHVFQLDPSEQEGIWTVHAFVQHAFFQPKHLVTQITVKTEQKRLEELRSQTFDQLGQPDIIDPDHDFDTTRFNETFGDHDYDHGARFGGHLPKDFKERSPAERKDLLEQEIKQHEILLGYLRKDGQQPDAVRACERHIARLRDTESTLDGDAQDGWRPFEIRGFFLGRGNQVVDGPLQLFGSARRKFEITQYGGSHDGVEVQIRDLSRRLDSDNYRFTGFAPTFEGALEGAFVDLCKKYPNGKVSIMSQGLSPDGKTSTGNTIGFELETATAWKDVKAKVFDPVVDLAVNIASAVVMIVFPVTVPVLLPITIAYNEAKNVDQMVDEIQSGTFTAKKAALHATQFALDVLPLVGRAPVIRGSRAAFAMFEVSNFGGQAVLMSEQVQETVRDLRDTQIADMARLYARYVALEKNTHQSDPDLVRMRAELDKRGKEIRDAAINAWTDAVKNYAIVALPSHAAQAINTHLATQAVSGLERSGSLHHVDGVDPHYDRSRGQIVGDQQKLDRPSIDRLRAEQAAHLREVGERLAQELGVSPDRIALKPATGKDGNRLWKDGDTIQVRYRPGTAPDVAITTWKKQAVALRVSGSGPRPPKPDPNAPPMPKPASSNVGAHPVPDSRFTGIATAGEHRPTFTTNDVAIATRSAADILMLTEEGGFRNVHTLGENRLLILNEGKQVRAKIVIGPPTPQVARHDYRANAKEVTITISKGANLDDVARATAHEIAEIQSLLVEPRSAQVDALVKGSSSEKLSAHDEGRLAELRVLLYELDNHPSDARRVEIKNEIDKLVEHVGFDKQKITKDPRAKRLLGTMLIDRIDQLANKRLSVRRDQLRITETLEKRQWSFVITADIPGFEDPPLLAQAHVSTDENGLPLGGPSFALDKRVQIDNSWHRLDVEGLPSLTSFALENGIKAFEKRFGHPPSELGGSLGDDNKAIFQREYVAQINNGVDRKTAELRAAAKTPFVKARAKRGYTVLEVNVKATANMPAGVPLKPHDVPTTIHITTRPR